jgi:ubiquinone/menaquinone biosynthesis C-methylase UbiE
MLLSDAWDQQSERWANWARKPGHDSFWRFHRDQFLQLVPSPGLLTVDIGCGEGRLTRHLQSLGHRTIGVDVSGKLIELAKEEDPSASYIVANAAKLPLENQVADLAIAFMSLQDIDDLQSAVSEIARVLLPNGKLVMAIVHPINSSGKFATEEADSEFIIPGDCNYFDELRYSDTFERDGLEMTFHSVHRSLDTYSRALEGSGFLMEAIREHPVPISAVDADRTKRWQRLPLFLHIRAVKQ